MADVNSQLASLALAEVGEEPLTSMEDAGKAAKVAKLVLPQAREEIFDLPIDWNFCTCRKQLTEYGTAPDFGYDYQYLLPEACRRIICFVDENGDDIQYPFKREIYISGSTQVPVLLTDQDECRVKFIAYITNSGYWPGWFKRLVIIKTAMYLAKPLTEDKREKLNLQYEFKDALKIAKTANAKELSSVDQWNVNTDYGNDDVLQAPQRVKSNRSNFINNYPGW